MASLKDKSSTILVIDQQEFCTVFSSILKDLGYKNVFSLKSLNEFIGYNNKENVLWIITHTHIMEPFSAFSLLKMALQDENYRSVRVTMLLDETEEDLIPFGLPPGMLSYHVGPITPNVLRNELRSVIQTSRQHPDYIIAAHFCRDYLAQKIGLAI